MKENSYIEMPDTGFDIRKHVGVINEWFMDNGIINQHVINN